MTEIEKMFENAGIKKVKDYYCPNCETKLEDWFGKHTDYICPNDRCDYALCSDEEDFQERLEHLLYREKHPPFTSDKQLELIKWLAIRFNSDYMSYWHNEIKDVWIFRLHDLTELSSEEPFVYEGRNKDFTESLCNLINALWQDLTDKEKEEIRNILNENS